MNKVLIFVCALAFTGCEYDNLNACYDPDLRNPQGPCPEVVLPVCGCDGITYENSCHAKNAGLLQWAEGECP